MVKILNFRVSSGLKDIIGKDLITDDYVAVFELVKNSYDAKAKQVIINFNDDSIIIADNGKGMTENELVNKWLFVAYSEKKINISNNSRSKNNLSKTNKSKRYFAGAKGIGRFSSDRLGKLLTLTTKVNNSNICDKIDINWDKFEKDQLEEFITIPVLHSKLSFKKQFPENSTHGTVLEIKNINEIWDREKIKGLKNSLEKLINPFSGINDFSIIINCNRELEKDKTVKSPRDKINGEIKNTIIDVLKLKTTQIETEVKKNYIFTTIIDRGEKIYKIREQNKLFPLLEQLKINLYYLNRKAKFNFTLKMGVEPINYGSIFLFKNGFRVYPYGEKGDDSWGLDNRAQQKRSSYLGTRDLFGKVELITENNENFKEVSSRDGGLVETTGAKQLMEVFTKAHRRLERYVSGILWGKDFIRLKYFENDEIAQKNRDILLENDKINENISTIKNSLGSKFDYILLIKSLVKDKSIKVEYYNKELLDIISERQNEQLPRFIKDLEIIADKTNDKNLKDNIFKAQQEIRKLNEEFDKKNKELEKEKNRRKKAENDAKDAKHEKEIALKYAKEQEEARKKAESGQEEAEINLKEKTKQNLFLQSIQSLDENKIIDFHHEIRVQAEIIKKRLNSLAVNILENNYDVEDMQRTVEIIGFATNKILSITYFATKANFKSSTEKIMVDIVSYIEQYIESIKVHFKEVKISIINKKNIELIKEFIPIEVNVVIDNLLNNSIKARANNFSINIDGESGKNVTFIFSDDGNGLDKEIIDKNSIFEKGITKTDGSGLGLYHAYSIVTSSLKGTIEINELKTKGFSLKVVLKK
jgi:signal transduction histidine kinase